MKCSKKKWIAFIIISMLGISLVKTVPPQGKNLFSESELKNKGEIIEKPRVTSISATVHINASDIIRELPSNLFGTGINYVNNGSEILNPDTLELYDGVIEKFAEMDISTVRFCGGSLSRDYHWWYGIGPKASRPLGTNVYTGEPTTNNYGIDEHFDFCQVIGAKPTIIVNYETGTPLEAANWVEYCNGEIPTSGTGGWTTSDFEGNETAPNGYFAWLRGKYGHTEPYDIANWEVANEVYDVWTQVYNATEYGYRFIDYYNNMSDVDASIKIAAIGYEDPMGIWNESGRDTVAWNQEVARIAGSYMDAINIHQYAPVASDGKTFFFFGNGEALRSVVIPQVSDYEILISARGLNTYGSQTYPSAPNNFANLSINIDGISQVNFSIDGTLDRIYNHTINFSAGTRTLGIELFNAATERQVMMLGEVRLLSKSSNDEIIVDYQNETKLYNSVMAAPEQFREQIKEIKQILESEIGPNDIEVWVTEFNTFYNTIGYRKNQQFQFKSAVAMADMAVQQVYGGADIVQTHCMLNDFYFGMLHEAKTLADTSMFDTYSLLADGLGQYLLNSTTNSLTFDLLDDFGWVDARDDVPYLDVLPTLNGDDLSVVLINKHPTESMSVSLDVEGFNSIQTAILKIINSSSINSMDYNPPDDSYEYIAGKVGKGIKLNASLLILYDSFNRVYPREGTIEFWIQPEWNGNDGLKHPIISIGNSLFIGKYGNDYLYAIQHNDEFDATKLLFADVSSGVAGDWNHVALTWDYSRENWTLYFNGTQVATDSFDNKTFFEHHIPMVLGSYNEYSDDSDKGLDGVIDEFRISKIARSAAEIFADFTAGKDGIPLSSDENSTILFHFDDSLEDSVEDQRTHISTNTIDYHSSGGNIYLPPCSISLLKLERYSPAQITSKNGDDDDDDDNDSQLIDILTSPIGLVAVAAFFGGIIFVIIKLKKKRSYKY